MLASPFESVEIGRDNGYVQESVVINVKVRLKNRIPAEGGFLSIFIPGD